jgi:chaperonin cofactor prefoldin
MKTLLCTLAVCLLLTVAFFTTQTLVREEGKRTRAALAKALEARPDALEPDASLPKRLEALNSQLDGLSRRMTALEETLASAAAKDGGTSQSVQADLAALRQELKGLSATQTRLGAVPGYLADLTRYLDQSFAHVEKAVSENAVPDTLAAAVDELAQRLDLIESLFVPLYSSLGLSQDPGNARPSPDAPSVDERLNTLSVQTEGIRQDIEALREWLTPRNIDPVKRPR